MSLRKHTGDRLLASLRWLLVAGWTVLTVALMLMPASEGSVAKNLSLFAGGSEVTDAIGHVILYGVLTGLWYWALRVHTIHAWAGALAVALTVGIGTELLQVFIPDRGASVLDLAANTIGPLLAVPFVRKSSRFKRAKKGVKQ